jgi:hypothetical protein
MKSRFLYSIYLLSLLVAIISSFSSCKFEEEDIFTDSPAIRMEKALVSYKDILCAAPNGWVMEYFPTSSTEGYTFLMKFSESSAVTIAAKNQYISNTYKTETSVYELTGDDGPVLSFNSYNQIFHLFSNPVDPEGSTDLDGYGLQGDYEFVIVSADSNTVRLKGKKRSTDIYLRRLDSNQSWPEYFAKIAKINASIFSSNVDTLKLHCNTDIFSAYDGISHIFSILEQGGDPVTDADLVPFIITPEGLRFHSVYTYNDNAFQNFKFNSDSTKLISEENSAVYFTGPELSPYLKLSSSTWKMDTVKMSNNFKSRLKSLASAMKIAYPSRSFEYFGISYKSTYLNTFVFKITNAEAAYRIDFTVINNSTINISLPTELSNLYDNNGKTFYNKTSEVATTLSYFAGEYTVTTETPFVINRVRYERTNNSNEYFEIYR